MSSSSTYVPPCMILDDHELEQAQKVRESFAKGGSSAAVSWRTNPEGGPTLRTFGMHPQGSNGFPNAFHTYGHRVAATATATVKRDSVPSKDPPGTLVNTVRMTFYNSEKNRGVHVPSITIPPVREVGGKQPPYSPKTPPYYEEDVPMHLIQ